jgi:membrane protein YdbS with pleckstrin-like domain
MMTDQNEPVTAIERPDPRLWTYYLISSLVTGPLFTVLLITHRLSYHSKRDRFLDEGVSMRWGVLFRKEINLTYARIQDIHLVSNFVERWLGLARIQIQTASGSARAEMTIEGVPAYEQLRDFLYSRMRGARGLPARGAPEPASGTGPAPPGELASLIGQAADELRGIRRLLEARAERGADDE